MSFGNFSTCFATRNSKKRRSFWGLRGRGGAREEEIITLRTLILSFGPPKGPTMSQEKLTDGERGGHSSHKEKTQS